jgi:hypothetical protein
MLSARGNRKPDISIADAAQPVVKTPFTYRDKALIRALHPDRVSRREHPPD